MARELQQTPLFNDANLKAYYRLENTADSKGSYTLTNNGTVTFTSAKFNNGANLGTSNSTKWLSVASNLGITTGSITMVGWVEILTEIDGGNYYELTDHSYHSATGNYDLTNRIYYQDNSGTPRLVFQRYTNAADSIYYNITLGTTNWYHLAYVFTAGVQVEGYVNGISVGTIPSTSTTYTNNTGDTFYIGTNGGGSYLASALFDDVAVFNRALTATEISDLYTSGGGGFFALLL